MVMVVDWPYRNEADGWKKGCKEKAKISAQI